MQDVGFEDLQSLLQPSDVRRHELDGEPRGGVFLDLLLQLGLAGEHEDVDGQPSRGARGPQCLPFVGRGNP
jgi:hypothetical protein